MSGGGTMYTCPECGVEIELGRNEYEVTCPGCRTELVLDVDADYRDGSYRDQSALIRKHG